MHIVNNFVIFFLSVFVIIFLTMPFGIPINNFASAFTQDIISSGNSNFQEIPFNLKQWINSGTPDSEIISTLQVNNETIDFPDTSLIMAIDGNNNILNNGDTTSSTLLKLDFVGQIDLTGSSQIVFECSIDSSVFEVCTSPIIIDNLKPKEHIFEVRAIDQSGKVDETPAQFRWIITDLAEKLKEIKMIIDDGEISSVLKNNLNVILSEIQTLIDNETPNNEHEICSNLEEFMLQITNNIDDISISDANALVEKTNSISEKIRC
jgi:hypothetical protein